MSVHDYDQNDPTFVSDLKESKKAVSRAAEWLNTLGYPVVVRPTFVRPSAEKMSEYSDDGDLEIIQRIEVKRRLNIPFTSKEDFPYKTIIVDVCHTYDNARPKPYAYIIFNGEMDCCFVIDCKTHGEWIRSEKWDKAKGRSRNFYECPVALTKFYTVG